MQDDPRETIRRLATVAGMPLPEERIAALSLALPFVQVGIVALSAVDYGEAEPASRFRLRPQPAR
jgi:hypothetical protein